MQGYLIYVPLLLFAAFLAITRVVRADSEYRQTHSHIVQHLYHLEGGR